MKIVMVSKALVVGAYQQKLAEIARHPDIELTVVVPLSWRDGAFESLFEPRPGRGYRIIVSPIAANGNFHLFFFPKLASILTEQQPDLLHIDEEPYNFATFMAVLQSRHRRIPSVFFTWQNLNRRYPFPFSAIERYIYRSVACAIAGTAAADRILREKGYTGPSVVIPQFGVDPDLFAPAGPADAADRDSGRPFLIGFAGRLVPEKGVDILIDACSALEIDYRLLVIGQGPDRARLEHRARGKGLEAKVQFVGSVPSTEMPAQLRGLDALVLPSRTRPNWAEQFGRILVEAMACGVPVIGSSCGEIPDVVGDAGLVVPEGDAPALTSALQRIASNPTLGASLVERGRARVLERFTHARIASETVDVYRRYARR